MQSTPKNHKEKQPALPNPESKHTPTPWELPNGKDKNKFGTYRIGEKPYNGGSAAHLTNIALVGSLEDAEFIVRAVNEYDWDQKRIMDLERNSEALLEALKSAQSLLKSQDIYDAEIWKAIAQAEGKLS